MCDNSKLRQSFALKSKQRFGDKYTCVSYVRKQGVRRYDATLVCNTHGIEFKIESSNHLRSEKGGCPKCVYEDRFPDLYKDSKRKCSKCNEYKELSHFGSNGKCKVRSFCNECNRARNKAENMNPSTLEKKRAADRERSKSQQGTETRKKAADKYNAKVKEQSFFSRLLSGLSKPVYHRTCTKCGKSEVLKKEPVGRSIDYCSDCSRSIGTNTGKKIHKPTIKECIYCGVTFEGSTGMSRVCKGCTEKNNKRLKNIYKTKRRAIERGAEAENIDKYQVFNRDKWRCKACGCKVQKKRIYDDNAAELDHIIPLAKRGTHTWDNVQTLCRKCNRDKSSSLEGQLRLRLG